MRVDQFDFDLPEDRIALRPARPRDSARLMVVGLGSANQHVHVSNLPEQLRAGDTIVVNDTRVIPAALRGSRIRDGSTVPVHINLAERVDRSTWSAFIRPGKRVAQGDRLVFPAPEGSPSDPLSALVDAKMEGGLAVLRFDLTGAELDAAITEIGQMPLPPYIAAKRAEDDADRGDYQTMFAEAAGAVAAPTAGLHFTPSLLDRLSDAGVGIAAVTLHVGPGTFLPVKAEDTTDHRMHAEWGAVNAETAAKLNAVRAAGGRVVAIGTTSLRLLESAVDDAGEICAFAGETDIFITPGYRFRAVDLLMTNFHLPRSTLFMLVSAFSGRERMQAAYREAIDRNYRFYSYGDACLLHPETADD